MIAFKRLLLPLLLLAVASLVAPMVSAAPRRPNVIVLLVDDQGYGDLSCHGNPVLKTPALDRLHAESIRLTDFHVAPMCTPTRSQLLTGVDALRNGAMNVSSGRALLRREYPTMADFFAAAGYRCGHFGKWHLGDNYPYRPQDRGFHETVYFLSSYIGAAADVWGNNYFDDTYWHKGVRRQFEGYCTDVFFQEASQFMVDSAAAGKPFFVYLPLNAAHTPLIVADKYKQRYAQQDPDVAAYFGMIANIDENVARLDALLAEQQLRDDTLLLFLTDNGGTFGVSLYNAGMRGKKMDLHEGGHRVPCFVRWPAGKLGAPRDIDALTQCQDIMPTLIDLCDLPNSEQAAFDGASLAPLLRGEIDSLNDRVCVVQFSRINSAPPRKGDACVMWNKWRLVGDNSLYNVGNDPGQENNLIALRPKIVSKLRKHYDDWWSGVAGQVNEPARIVVGNDAENPVRLSPADWFDAYLDQQAQVRQGIRKNAPWQLHVEQAGRYEVTLSRWPFEDAAPIPGRGPDGDGEAIPAVTARLRIAGIDQTKPVGGDDSTVTFAMELPAGEATLQTWFHDTGGQALCGAYYVLVRRL